MNKKTLECLYRELPGMVSAGVVPQDVADRIRLHFGDPSVTASVAKKWAIVLFGILGAVLIGGGIILMLAHNWDELSRPARAAVSLLLLVTAQVLGAWLLWTGRKSTAWMEGVGAFQTLGIGAAIALVAQTYNIGGRFEVFMLTWSLLALPVAYLLGATFPALFYLIGITVWAGAIPHHEGAQLWYFLLFLLALPFLWLTGRVEQYHSRAVLFGWVMAITVCIGSGIAMDQVCSPLRCWPVVFGGLFGLLFLSGTRWWGEAPSSWQSPFQIVGALGSLGLALVLSFRESWTGTSGWVHSWQQIGRTAEFIALALTALLIVTAVGMWVSSFTRRRWQEAMLGGVPILALIGWVFAMANEGFVAIILFNLYLAMLGIGTLAIGLRGKQLGVVNAGMGVLAALILCRFFDSDLGFMLRGVAFILIGIGFLAANLLLLRSKGESNE